MHANNVLYDISLLFSSSLKFIEINICTILTNGRILLDLVPISYTVATFSVLMTCHFQVIICAEHVFCASISQNVTL